MSAVGSFAIAGASRWLDATALTGAFDVETAAPIATAAALATAASATALFLIVVPPTRGFARRRAGEDARRRGPRSRSASHCRPAFGAGRRTVRHEATSRDVL